MDKKTMAKAELKTMNGYKEDDKGILFTLINMSDPYTFYAKNYKIAIFATWTLSELYGSNSEDGKYYIPLAAFAFRNRDEKLKYIEKECGSSTLTNEEMMDVASALRTFVISSFYSRRGYESKLKKIKDVDEQINFIIDWHDKHITSTNNIRSQAFFIANRLEELSKKENKTNETD